jgi:radical SAM superfamily enzyme YgiQ (UPF0313 family)
MCCNCCYRRHFYRLLPAPSVRAPILNSRLLTASCHPLPPHSLYLTHNTFTLYTDRLVRACSELPKLCEFFHIPFQSGDDDILREMKRGYTAARYTSIIDNIRRYMPDASISGDAIVGFPGGCGWRKRLFQYSARN